MLCCAYDNCTVRAEIQKNRYTYYHCIGFRGKCDLPYFREEEVASRLGKVLQDIHIPDDVLGQLEKSLLTDKGRDEAIRKQQGELLKQRLSAVRHRLDRAYLDKLDGKINEEFWTRKSAEWLAEEQQISLAIHGLANANPDRIIDAVRISNSRIRRIFCMLANPPLKKPSCSEWCFRTALWML